MPTTYIHANGVKIGHIKDDVRTDYLTDALGSVTATKNQSQQIVNTYRYKPYGGLLAKTGTGDDPRYLWRGARGLRRPLGLMSLCYHFESLSLQLAIRLGSIDNGPWPQWNRRGPYLSGGPVQGNEDPGGDLIGPGEREHVARVRSLRTAMRVVGRLRLPERCDLSTRQYIWYNFYVAFAHGHRDDQGTIVDCGVSIQCTSGTSRGAGWRVNLNPHGGSPHASCPQCRPGATINIEIIRDNDGNVTCNAGGGTLSVNVASLRHNRTAVGQMAMGAINNPNFLEKHSISEFLGMQLDNGAWANNNRTQPQLRGGYKTDGVDRAFLLAAHLFHPSQDCSCPDDPSLIIGDIDALRRINHCK